MRDNECSLFKTVFQCSCIVHWLDRHLLRALVQIQWCFGRSGTTILLSIIYFQVYRPHGLHTTTVHYNSLCQSSHIPHSGPVAETCCWIYKKAQTKLQSNHWPMKLNIRLHFVSSDQLMQQDASYSIMFSVHLSSTMKQRIIYSRLWFYLNTLHDTSNCEAAYSETTERNPWVVKMDVFKPPTFLSLYCSFPLARCQ
jgi:hypothetical protein